MSLTVQYLQSDGAAQDFEVSVLANCMVQDAARLAASDLHIEPWEKAIAVRARVNGVLVDIAHLPLELLDKISTRFKVMANLVTYQSGTPQDGSAIGGPEVDGVQLRISIFPTTRGEKIVIRLFDPRDRGGQIVIAALGLRNQFIQRLGAESVPPTRAGPHPLDVIGRGLAPYGRWRNVRFFISRPHAAAAKREKRAGANHPCG